MERDHLANVQATLDEAIAAVYSSEWGIDEAAHVALGLLVYTFTYYMCYGACSDETLCREQADIAVRDLNMRVDATDGRFYFGG